MRVIGWVLLVLGLGMAAAGAARNGPALVEHRQATARVSMLQGARLARETAEGRVAAAEGPEAAAEARAALEAARARIEGLRAAGTFEGSLDEAIEEAQDSEAATSLPPPGRRFLDWLGAGGLLFGVGAVLTAVGGLLVRRAAREAATGGGAGASGPVDVPAHLDRIDSALEALAEGLRDLPMDAPSTRWREQLDALQETAIDPVVEGRVGLAVRQGTTAFALWFGPFSAGERHLARVWSALTDGHSEVARTALDRARTDFAQARAAYRRAEGTEDAPG